VVVYLHCDRPHAVKSRSLVALRMSPMWARSVDRLGRVLNLMPGMAVATVARDMRIVMSFMLIGGRYLEVFEGSQDSLSER
jgi:hypothetical protein